MSVLLNRKFEPAERSKQKSKTKKKDFISDITKQKKTKRCTEREFLAYIKHKIGPKKKSIEKLSLVWVGEIVECEACSRTITDLRSKHCHCGYDTHTKKWEERKKQKEVQKRIAAKSVPEKLPRIGQIYHNHRVEALRAIASAGMPLTDMESLSEWIDSISKTGYNLGHARDIPRICGPTLHAELKK